MTWTTHLTQTWRTQGLKAQNLMKLTSQMMLFYSHLQMCSSSLRKQGLRQSGKHKTPKSVRDITKGTEQSLCRFHANQRAIAAVGKQGFISSWLTASATNVEADPTCTPTSVSQYIFNSTDKAHHK